AVAAAGREGGEEQSERSLHGPIITWALFARQRRRRAGRLLRRRQPGRVDVAEPDQRVELGVAAGGRRRQRAARLELARQRARLVEVAAPLAGDVDGRLVGRRLRTQRVERQLERRARRTEAAVEPGAVAPVELVEGQKGGAAVGDELDGVEDEL